jgi:hypothetical protein
MSSRAHTEVVPLNFVRLLNVVWQDGSYPIRVVQRAIASGDPWAIS